MIIKAIYIYFISIFIKNRIKLEKNEKCEKRTRRLFNNEDHNITSEENERRS